MNCKDCSSQLKYICTRCSTLICEQPQCNQGLINHKSICPNLNILKFTGEIDFSGAILKESKFLGAQLIGVNFRNADLSGADFTGANLSGADFTGANLEGVNFSDCEAKEMLNIIKI